MFYLWCSSWYLLGIVVARITSELLSCVSSISNSGSAVWLLYQWRVEMKPGYMAKLKFWKFFLHVNINICKGSQRIDAVTPSAALSCLCYVVGLV